MSRLAGIGFIAAATGCFALMDSATKAVSVVAPMMMALAMRNGLQAALVAGMLLPRRGLALLRTRRPLLQVLRGLMLLGCSGTAFIAVQVMPVAEFTAIVLLTPLALTALAAWRGDHRVGALQWALVLGGFVGALLIVRPSAAGGPALAAGIGLPLAIIVVNTAYQWLTALLARREDAGTLQLWTAGTGLAVTAAALPFVWTALPAWAWGLLVLLAALATLAHGLLILAYRHAPVAVLSPYLYLQIAYATLGGWLFFGQWPDARAALGIALIAACGAAGTRLSGAAPRSSSSSSTAKEA
jgi:drug/metabolite transporter (DMT)-like permease